MSGDRVSPEVRGRIMSRIRSSGTAPERAVMGWLSETQEGGKGFVMNDRALPGSPDFHFPSLKKALFVDGAFWHGHPDHFRFGKSGERWDRKIGINIQRDRKVDLSLKGMGYSVMRVWDFEVMGKGSKGTKERVVQFIREAGKNGMADA